MWQVYILKCADGTFYTGITTDLKRRVHEHNNLPFGAKYTKSRRPVKLVFSRNIKNRPLAAKEEIRIKRLPKKEKIKLVQKK
jgi:putative endonuclease